MARNKGIFPLSDHPAVCATLTPLPCRQPARLRERLLGAVWAILAASGAVLSTGDLQQASIQACPRQSTINIVALVF